MSTTNQRSVLGFLATIALVAFATPAVRAAPATDGHRLLIADVGFHGVRQVGWSAAGVPAVFVPAADHGLAQPSGIVVGPDCRVYVASYTTGQILVYLGDGTYSESISMPLIGSTQYLQPCDVAFGPRDGLMYVTAINQQMVLTYDLTTHVWNQLFAPGTMSLPSSGIAGGRPAYMAFLPNGHLLFSDYQDGEVLEWNQLTSALSVAVVSGTSGLSGAENILLGPRDDLFVVSYNTDQVLRFSRALNYTAAVVFAPSTAGEVVDSPHGLAFAPDGQLFVGNRGTNEIFRYAVPKDGPPASCLGVYSSGHNVLALTFESRACFGAHERGEMVATYCPELVFSSTWGVEPDHDAPVVKMFDPDVVPYPELGANTIAPLFSNMFDTTASNRWTFGNLGPVFGTAVDRSAPPNIYVAASTVHGQYGSIPLVNYGRVYKLDGTTKAITVFRTLTNSGVGLGDCTWDRYHNILFVSNFEDGCISSYNKSGTVHQAPFAPFGVTDPDDGLMPSLASGCRIWALHTLSANILIFSVWIKDSGHTGTLWPAAWGPPLSPVNNAIFGIKLNALGMMVGTPKLLRIMPPINGSGANEYSNPVSDIDVREIPNPNVYPRDIYVAERTMYSDFGGPGIAHESRAFDIFLPWGMNGPPYLVGDYANSSLPVLWQHANSAGGIAADRRLSAWCSGDAIHYTGVDDYLYGVQRIPSVGNGICTTPTGCCMLIDLDSQTIDSDKAQPGEVEYCPGY